MAGEAETKYEQICRQIADRIPNIELKGVQAYTLEGEPLCLIDFVRKNFEPHIDCKDYCEYVYELEYEECVEECEEKLEMALIGSIAFRLDGSIVESTIPASCEHIYPYEEEDIEEFERRKARFFDRFHEIGCEVKEDWIHPHELIEEVPELWEYEYPALCYFHPEGKEGKCKVNDVMKLIAADRRSV